MNDNGEFAEMLAALKERHRKLDEKISRLDLQPFRDPIETQRLKREKLALKDQINHLRDSSVPDIIA